MLYEMTQVRPTVKALIGGRDGPADPIADLVRCYLWKCMTVSDYYGRANVDVVMSRVRDQTDGSYLRCLRRRAGLAAIRTGELSQQC